MAHSLAVGTVLMESIVAADARVICHERSLAAARMRHTRVESRVNRQVIRVLSLVVLRLLHLDAWLGLGLRREVRRRRHGLSRERDRLEVAITSLMRVRSDDELFVGGNALIMRCRRV